MISTESINVAMKKSSVATWKGRGLEDLDPKRMGDEGYDGTTYDGDIPKSVASLN